MRKLVNVHQVWRDLQKNAKKLQDVFKRRQQEFVSSLDNLFDIAHANALQLMKIEEDRMFWKYQRESGRPGHVGGVNKKLTDKEERARLRVVKEENRRIKYVSASKSSASCEPLQEDSSSNSSENIDSEDFPTLIESSEPGTSKSVMRKDFITPKESIDDFISVKSQQLFSRLKIVDSFLNESPSSWANDASFLDAKKTVSMLRAVNDTTGRAVKMVQDFHGLITVEEEQKQFLLRCVQEHMKIYPDDKKQTVQ
ncbi:hypothetical protein AVEN_160265-1 [Araneus ventricosus]|uniref:Uncharacterized protein n=1 Tax=Araneus ventricosus TaxID=182803 RepID=A0A4Y2L5U5_ARAVE|nr:hypothetical protein AVEN_160265-1 [Araneus ventricosus]